MNLTINEQLMHDTKDANLCIFIANLAGWLKTNAGKLHKPLEERNFRENRYWSYNSIEGFVKYFGFWSTQNIKTIIKKGIALGLIVTSNFNRKKFDNTLWYSLTDKGLSYYPYLLETTLNTLVSSNKPLVRTNNAIPEDPTTCSNNTITTSESADSSAPAPKNKSKSNIDLRSLINIYAKWFPDNPQPHKKGISTSLEKTLKTLIKRWPEAHPEGREFTADQFDKYMELLSQNAPRFSKGEYTTENGRKKKNGMVTFCRWDIFIKFLENQYS